MVNPTQPATGSGDLSARDISKLEHAETPNLDGLGQQIERFERWLNMLEANLSGVLIGQEQLPGPERMAEPVPDNRLQTHIIDLEKLLNRAEDIRSRIRL